MTTTETVETAPVVLTMNAHRLDDLMHQVEKANGKLRRAGLTDEIFRVDIVRTYTETAKDALGNTYDRGKVDYTLNRPQNKIAGWTFVARLDVLADGTFITAVVPGQELNGYRPADQRCEKCGTDRYRKNTYLLRNEQGEMKQVGGNCLEAFLGVEVKGLWALDWEPELGDDDDDQVGGMGRGWVRIVTPLEVVAAALAATDNGKGYVTRNAYTGRPTVGLVNDLLFPNKWNEKDEDVKAARQALNDLDPALAQEVLEFAKNLEGATDYATNMRALAGQETIETRHIGLVASVVAAWHREKVGAAERKVAAVDLNEWVGKVGDKVTGIAVTVTNVRELDGQWGTTTLFIYKDVEGRVYKWFASGAFDVEPGDEVTILRGTVKEHEEYQGRKQTLLTRVKFEKREA